MKFPKLFKATVIKKYKMFYVDVLLANNEIVSSDILKCITNDTPSLILISCSLTGDNIDLKLIKSIKLTN